MVQWETGISILESVSNLEGSIDKEAVRETVGLPSMEKMIDILGAIIQGDINKTLKISNELMDEVRLSMLRKFASKLDFISLIISFW